jgi:hypothetical protein
MKTNKKMMIAIALAGALGFVALDAAPAEAWELCARKDKKTGAIKKGPAQFHKKCSGNWVRVARADTLALLDPLDEQDLELLEKMEMVDNDGDGVDETVRFTGVNVQVVSGSGATDDAVNGLGNLVVGYDEDSQYVASASASAGPKTGSHNLIVGVGHSYSSYGGIVGGQINEISGPYASISGGNYHVASGEFASISGGHNNQATGPRASISGGAGNIASGSGAAVSGGRMGVASGEYASVSGGYSGGAIGKESWAGGGYNGSAYGDHSSVSGGEDNLAEGARSSVTGGSANEAVGHASSISSGSLNIAFGDVSWVGGGNRNAASGFASSISGGNQVSCSTAYGVCP